MTTRTTGTALVPRRGDDSLQRATDWVALPADERHRRAATAAQAHDSTALLDLLQAWLTLYGHAGANLSGHTLRNYSYGARLLLDAWRQVNLLRPSRDDAALWLRTIEATGQRTRDGSPKLDRDGHPIGLSPASVRLYLAAARALYSALRWTRATDADPFADLRPAPDGTKSWDRRKPYPPREVDALLRAAAGEDRVLILLAGHAGLRVAECLSLRWADVNLPARELTVARGKGGKRRVVPLSGTLAAALGVLPRNDDGDDGYVLSVRTTEAARFRLRRLTSAHDLPYRGIHALRHACGTRLVSENGGDLEAAARLLGHSTIETTRAYVKWSDEGLRKTLDTW